MTLKALREARAAKVAEARALVETAQRENRQLTAEESATFDTIKAAITDLEQQEQRQQFLDDAERRSTGTVVSGGSDTLPELEKRVSLLTVVQAKIDGRALTGAEAEYHAEAERRTGMKAQGVLVPLSLLERRAPNLTTTAGELIPTDHRGDQYIGPLRDSLVVRQMGVRVLSSLTGNVEIPKFAAGLSAGWVAENEALPESVMDFDSVSLKPRHVGAITSWSRQLAQQSNPSIEQLLRDDLAFAVGAEVDKAIITGDGVKAPLGIINTAGVQTATVPTTWEEVLAVEGLLEDVNVTPNYWYTKPSVLRALRGKLKAATAGSEYIATANRIGEIAAATSNAAPANTAILGDWTQLILGTWGVLDLLVNPYEGEAFRRGNVLIRAMMTCDLVARHPKAFVVAKPATGG
ncbi:phage major capsid protein [Stenotrophomonas maltophilia]|uniref:phage major capsid protein n=1 Tax=Stenotrophomonas maltophilia TaxID=40324 RepID=UPI0013DB9D10|nr:phage major capsid protein [Stenotrophomonas maltophilia]